MSVSDRSLVTALAGETLDWMAVDPTREDVADEVWAYSLATFVDGTPITPRGYDVSEQFGPRYCCWCYAELTDEPAGSTLCRECFFGPPPEYVPLFQRLKSWIGRPQDTGKSQDGFTEEQIE